VQATFLALSDHARAGRTIDHPASWLHRVARNLAVHVRDAAVARRRHEAGAGAAMIAHRQDPSAADPEADADLASLRGALDEALGALPERYRQPLILHYLEGRTFEDIARTHRTTSGTVASWLSRGRSLLRDRLARRGHPVGAATLGTLLAGSIADGGHTAEAAPFGALDAAHGRVRALADLAKPSRGLPAALWALPACLLVAVALIALRPGVAPPAAPALPTAPAARVDVDPVVPSTVRFL
jgi:RNA polymerase sigma factor (sigma-70 family)